MRSDIERVPNGEITPERDTVISISHGHRFLVVGRDDWKETTVTSQGTHQAFHFDHAAGKNGTPAFYTQIEWLRGFPIVASQKVNPTRSKRPHSSTT